ncbi:unnamed protein product [Cunninghamella echinulata]
MEISQEICKILNGDWTFYPQIVYACTQILAGIIYGTECKNYGRRKTVGNHHEPFGIKEQDSTVDNPLPSTFNQVLKCVVCDP